MTAGVETGGDHVVEMQTFGVLGELLPAGFCLSGHLVRQSEPLSM